MDVIVAMRHTCGMNNNGRVAPSIVELRELAQAAGVGNVAEPAPVRLDDLRRQLTANREFAARLAERPLEKAS